MGLPLYPVSSLTAGVMNTRFPLWSCRKPSLNLRAAAGSVYAVGTPEMLPKPDVEKVLLSRNVEEAFSECEPTNESSSARLPGASEEMALEELENRRLTVSAPWAQLEEPVWMVRLVITPPVAVMTAGAKGEEETWPQAPCQLEAPNRETSARLMLPPSVSAPAADRGGARIIRLNRRMHSFPADICFPPYSPFLFLHLRKMKSKNSTSSRPTAKAAPTRMSCSCIGCSSCSRGTEYTALLVKKPRLPPYWRDTLMFLFRLSSFSFRPSRNSSFKKEFLSTWRMEGALTLVRIPFSSKSETWAKTNAAPSPSFLMVIRSFSLALSYLEYLTLTMELST